VRVGCAPSYRRHLSAVSLCVVGPFGHEGVDIENRIAILQVSLQYERVG
jgi:hypothetical protein